MAPHLTPTKKARVWQYHCDGVSNAEIARRMGRDSSTIDRLVIRMTEHPDPYYRPPGRGRPPKLNSRDLRLARRKIESGEVADAADLKRNYFPDVGDSTMRRALANMGLNGRVRRHKPLLTAAHILKRKQFAAMMKTWTAEQRAKLWYSDESKYNLIGSDGKRYCRRRPGEEFKPQNVTKMVAHGGGSVMVWGVISRHGTGRLYRITGNVNAAAYIKILNKALLPSLSDAGVDVGEMILVQDNAPAHRSAAAKSWFEENDMETLPWPPSSPDLNLIENLWEYLDRQVRKRRPLPSNVNQLWRYLEEEWARIDNHIIDNLYASIPRRIEAVEKAKGLWTKY